MRKFLTKLSRIIYKQRNSALTARGLTKLYAKCHAIGDFTELDRHLNGKW